jgi:hypothetical protein
VAHPAVTHGSEPGPALNGQLIDGLRAGERRYCGFTRDHQASDAYTDNDKHGCDCSHSSVHPPPEEPLATSLAIRDEASRQ